MYGREILGEDEEPLRKINQPVFYLLVKAPFHLSFFNKS
jgi:hypothetical protein